MGAKKESERNSSTIAEVSSSTASSDILSILGMASDIQNKVFGILDEVEKPNVDVKASTATQQVSSDVAAKNAK